MARAYNITGNIRTDITRGSNSFGLYWPKNEGIGATKRSCVVRPSLRPNPFFFSHRAIGADNRRWADRTDDIVIFLLFFFFDHDSLEKWAKNFQKRKKSVTQNEISDDERDRKISRAAARTTVIYRFYSYARIASAWRFRLLRNLPTCATPRIVRAN